MANEGIAWYTPPPPVNFFAAEWNRFWNGLAGLTPEQLSQAMAERAAKGGTPGAGSTINVPGFGDVIKTGPTYQPTAAEYQEFFGANAAGRPANLSADALSAIQGKLSKWEGAANSAQPEWSQAFGQIATAFDNIQDFTVATAALGRLALWAGLWGVGHSSGIAGKLVEKALIPGLGTMLIVADVLNWLAWAAMLAMFGYGAICASPRQALAAALPPLIMRPTAGVRPCGIKAKAGGVLDSNPFAQRGKMFNKVFGKKPYPTLPELLQFAQTMDQLTGFGLAFGAVVGAVMEAAYAAAMTGTGTAPGFNTPLGTVPATHSPDPVGGGNRHLGKPVGVAGWHHVERRLSAANKWGLEVRYQAAAVVTNGPLALQGVPFLTERDQLDAIVALAGAWDILRQDLANVDVAALVRWACAQHIAPGGFMSATTAALMRSQGHGLETAARWPVQGAPATLLGGELVNAFGAALPVKLGQFLLPRRDQPVGLFYGGMLTGTLRSIFGTIAEDRRGMPTEWTEESRWLLSMAEGHRVLYPTEDEEAVWRFFQAGVGQLRDSGRGALSGEELDQLAAAESLTLMIAEQAYLRE